MAKSVLPVIRIKSGKPRQIKMENVNVRTLFIMITVHVIHVKSFWTVLLVQVQIIAQNARIKETLIPSLKKVSVFVNHHFGSIKLNVLNAVNLSQIANFVVEMETNVHNANHKTVSPTNNNQNVYVLTLNIKINKLKNANPVTHTKTV